MSLRCTRQVPGAGTRFRGGGNRQERRVGRDSLLTASWPGLPAARLIAGQERQIPSRACRNAVKCRSELNPLARPKPCSC